MANKAITNSASKRIGKAITLVREATEEISAAKLVLEKYNNDRKSKDEEIEEVMFFIDDLMIETENLQKDMYAIGIRMGEDAYENMLAAERFRVFCALKDLYKEKGLPYYFVSYEKTLKESISSLYASSINGLNADACKLLATIMTAINSKFSTDFSTDTLQNTKTKDLAELLCNKKKEAILTTSNPEE